MQNKIIEIIKIIKAGSLVRTEPLRSRMEKQITDHQRIIKASFALIVIVALIRLILWTDFLAALEWRGESWVINLSWWESLKTFLIILVEIVGILIVIVFVVMMFARFFKLVEVLPFDIDVEDLKCNGKATSDLLIAEMQKIQLTYNKAPNNIRQRPTEMIILPNLSQTCLDFDAVVLDVSNAKISVGQLILALRRISSNINAGIISGSLHKYGSSAYLVAHIDGKRSTICKVHRNVYDKDRLSDEIPEMVSDLAYKITKEICQKDVPAKTWKAFKYYIFALDKYNKYINTNNVEMLWLAEDSIFRAAEAEPDYEDAFNLIFYIGYAYINIKKYEEARVIFQEFTRLRPDNTSAFVWLGYVYEILGDKVKSDEFYKIAIKLNPNDTYDWNNKGFVFIKFGLYDEAIKCCDKATELYPEFVTAWNNKGIAFYEICQFEMGLDCFDKVTKLNPKHASAWNSKGVALGQLKKLDPAIACYEKAIELDPKYPLAWTNKGVTYCDWGKYEEAIESFHKALELDPNFLDAQIFLALLYRELASKARCDTDKHVLKSRYEKQCNTARDLVNGKLEYDRACFEAVCDNPEHSMRLLKVALNKKEVSPDWVCIDPHFKFIRDKDPRFHLILGSAFELLGKYSDAHKAYRKANGINSHFAAAHVSLARYYRKLSCKAERNPEKYGSANYYRREFNKFCNFALESISNEDYTHACLLATRSVEEKDLNKAFNLLEKISKNLNNIPVWAIPDLDFEFVKDNDRFHKLLDKLSNGTKI